MKNEDEELSEKTGPLLLFSEGAFLWFLCGTMLTNAAQWIQSVTLNWLVYDISSSGTLLGTINIVRSIATIGLAPLAGWAIDRFSKRRLLYINSLWLCGISLIFGLILLPDSSILWPLFLFSFFGGMGRALSMPLRQTAVFSIVRRPLIPNAVAVIQTGWAVMRSIGPAIGGFLILWLGPAGNFFVQAAAYMLVFMTLLKLKMPYEQQQSGNRKEKTSFKDGFKYLISNREALGFALMNLILTVIVVPNFTALTPIYAKDVFNGGPDTLGLLLSSIGAGGIIGGIFVSSLKKFEHRGFLQLSALILLGCTLLAYSFSKTLLSGMICLGLCGFFELIFITTNMTLLQLSIPGSIRGRVMGILSLRSGLMPVGSFLAGVGADALGPRLITRCFAGGTMLIALCILIFVPWVRNYRLSEHINS